MKCRIIPLFAAVASVPMLFGATPLNAQEAQRWTLEECIAYAFEHNIEVKQAELDVQTKRLTRSDAGWAYAPDISASSSYSFSSGRVLDPTTYEFVEHQSVNGTSTSVGASVTLFNGMRNLHNLERSRLDLRAALLGVEKARNDIRLNITAYYLEILCAEENIRNAEQTVETLKIQEEKTRKSVEMGKVTSADLLQIRSQLANAENTLLSARNSYDIARLNICQLLEIEDYTTFHTVAPSDNILGNTPMPVSTDALLASAQQLPEVESARLGIDIARRDLRIARSSYYPTLSLSAGYELLELLRTSNVGNSRIIPIIVTTASGSCNREELLERGFSDCLLKPFSISELMEVSDKCAMKGKQNEKPDFSSLLSYGNESVMLDKLIAETEKEMQSVRDAEQRKDFQELDALTHHLHSSWEILRADQPLRELYKQLHGSAVPDYEALNNAVTAVLDKGSEIIRLAKEERRKYENG